MQPKKFSIEIGGRPFIIETGHLAEQANGAVLATYGGTTVLATAVMSKRAKDCDYLPLTLEYEEKLYAAGKIKQSRFVKREGRASDEAISTGRMIDRCLRPLFDQRIRNEIQVVATVLSFDKENDPDIVSLIACSCALMISDIAWPGPVSAVRVGRQNGQLIINPTYQQIENSNLEIIVSGHGKRINMLEGGAKEIPEQDLLQAIEFGQKELEKIIAWQKQISQEIGKEKKQLELQEIKPEFIKLAKNFLKGKLEKLLYEPDKTIRLNSLNQLQDDLTEKAAEAEFNQDLEKQAVRNQVEEIFGQEVDQIVHHNILDVPAGKEKRPDGRRLDEVRELECQIGFLARTHGSGLFRRGTTQALSIVTLGAPGDEQTLESMELDVKKHFFHHYNFPPFCTGETGRMSGPGRREIGHGALAEKALLPLIPVKEKFPYTIRVVSEILSSNGSSSMASVTGSSLALMDAGVPIKAAVSGIAMGLMSDSKGSFKVLTDIQGPEDHHGDMDCKIAGTCQGVTALQMDVKIEGVTLDILKKVFEQAKKARMEILEAMNKTIKEPKANLSPFAPRIISLQINPEKIGAVIGPQGKIINEIIDQTGVSIDIEDSGLVFITSENEQSAQEAIARIKNLTREAKVGEIFQGKVVKITDFGAFVEIIPGQDGLVHISELAPYRVRRVEDVVNLGDVIPVKVKEIGDNGKISLTLKDAKK